GSNQHYRDRYAGLVTVDDFLFEMRSFSQNETPIIVIDEFNEIRDENVSMILANILKALSDIGSNVTLVIVGIANSVLELMQYHHSIQRCMEEVHVPRVSSEECYEILAGRLSRLGMTMPESSMWTIINLSYGLPGHVQSLGKFTVTRALQDGRLDITDHDV